MNRYTFLDTLLRIGLIQSRPRLTGTSNSLLPSAGTVASAFLNSPGSSSLRVGFAE